MGRNPLKRIRTASIATLGCKLNQSESDQMGRRLVAAGVELVPFGEPADLCLINSCTVTHIGDRKSRQLIRHAVRANPEAFVAVAGCYAELEADAVAQIQGVDAVLGNRGKDRLVEFLMERGLEVGDSSALPGGDEWREDPSHAAGDLKPVARTRAFVKIQEGCDNRCSYCIVPQARGEGRSRPADDVVREIREFSAEGYQEVVLTGVNITAYGRGRDFGDAVANARGMGLYGLLERILAETDLPRLRLSSLQPEEWDSRFYGLWSSGRLCRQLHFSLQSGSDGVLRRMRRRYNADRYRRTVAEAREALPGVAITTDVIAGFPGETGAEQLETEGFLREIGFAGLHVFKYSPRSGTVAAEMAGQLDPRVKQERSQRLIDLGADMGNSFRSGFVGSVLSVLWEERVPEPSASRLLQDGSGEPCWTGLSDNYIRVYARNPREMGGNIGGVRVERLVEEGVTGTTTRKG
jgi:threonylcarbamoyladenosine tRNA methylthiotransferase MtaB